MPNIIQEWYSGGMHVVTAGTAFIDIDAYGSMVAMAELLRRRGKEALAASSAPFNSSVPPSLRKLDVRFETNYTPSPEDCFTIVDLSDPEHFDFKATPEKVVMVIDHHLGFKEFWQERLGDQAHIEFIGAACTLVYELWQQAGLAADMSQNSAKLLACGILDNTLNLKADITTDRDRAAYDFLAAHAGLSADWPRHYFSDCQAYALKDMRAAIQSDAKTIQYPNRSDQLHVGQIVLWDADKVIQSHQDAVMNTLAESGRPWYMNFIDVKNGISVFFCQDRATQTWLVDLLGISFAGDLAHADRMWLRKEIFKQSRV